VRGLVSFFVLSCFHTDLRRTSGDKKVMITVAIDAAARAREQKTKGDYCCPYACLDHATLR
jgi:hypothetical protein